MLYISCHPILEYNEISLFNEIGIDVFSLGWYLNPTTPQDLKRPPLNIKPKPELIKLVNPKYNLVRILTKELVDKFDIIYIMHTPEWLINNWNIIKNKIVIWRSVGQSNRVIESNIKPYRGNIKIIRYSPYENYIPGYIGHDFMIRFHLDPNEFNNWNGKYSKVISVAGYMKRRHVCNYNVFDTVTKHLPRILYGPGNEDTGNQNGGILSYGDLKSTLRDNRVFFYTGSSPACYTLGFMEAWMTGIPIVAIGNIYANLFQKTYEIPNLIRNEVNGFYSDDIRTLHKYCRMLLGSDNLARLISAEGRKSAIEYFGKDKIKKQWIEFFKCI